MQAALNPLLGWHHLAAFHRAGSSRKHSWVEVQEATCSRRGSLIQIELQANGFLYGMVRLLVGLLAEVGRGWRSPEYFTSIWQEQRRDQVKYAAPPNGLCLLRIGYPDFPFPAELWFDAQPQFCFTAPVHEHSLI
jgi:tRNA pseudouridine38-40 synthase